MTGRLRAVCRVPLITQFYGAFQDAYQIFLVMEYCSGGDLLERLKKENRAMSERRVILEVAVPLLRTLQHMHGHSIIHRWAPLLHAEGLCNHLFQSSNTPLLVHSLACAVVLRPWIIREASCSIQS